MQVTYLQFEDRHDSVLQRWEARLHGRRREKSSKRKKKSWRDGLLFHPVISTSMLMDGHDQTQAVHNQSFSSLHKWFHHGKYFL